MPNTGPVARVQKDPSVQWSDHRFHSCAACFPVRPRNWDTPWITSAWMFFHTASGISGNRCDVLEHSSTQDFQYNEPHESGTRVAYKIKGLTTPCGAWYFLVICPSKIPQDCLDHDIPLCITCTYIYMNAPINTAPISTAPMHQSTLLLLSSDSPHFKLCANMLLTHPKVSCFFHRAHHYMHAQCTPETITTKCMTFKNGFSLWSLSKSHSPKPTGLVTKGAVGLNQLVRFSTSVV